MTIKTRWVSHPTRKLQDYVSTIDDMRLRPILQQLITGLGDTHTVIAINANNTILGISLIAHRHIHHGQETTWIRYTHINPAYRGKGIAQQIFRAIATRAQTQHSATVTCIIDTEGPEQEATRQLLAKAGFSQSQDTTYQATPHQILHSLSK